MLVSVCLFPILMVVWPRAFQYCAGFSGRLGLDAKSMTPEELSLINILWGFCHQHPFSPTTPVSHSQPHLPRRLSKTHSWSCLLSSYCFVPEYVNPCVFLPSVESLFPPSPVGNPALKSCWTSNPMLWGFLLQMPGPQAGDPDMRLRALTLMGKPLPYNYFKV